jgi:sugar lactone lactonase YvrE
VPGDTAVRVAFDVRCKLGEGPIWHSERRTLLWFDIYGQVLYEADADGGAIRTFGFGEPVSAAALVDGPHVVVASASGLHHVNLETGERSRLASLEADNPATRSNDCRVGPGGRFWVSTMADPVVEGMGSLYGFKDGKLERLRAGVTIPNSIAFSADGALAYFADTWDQRILRFRLDPATGLPWGEPELFLDLSSEGLRPDGAVVDAEGCLWNAQFGAGRVARYRPDGRLDRVVELPVSLTTCPAFGGPDLRTLFVTSAWAELDAEQRRREPFAGAVFAFEVDTPGIPERRMTLGGSA